MPYMPKKGRPAYMPKRKQPGNKGENATLYNSRRWRSISTYYRMNKTVELDGYGCEVCHQIDELSTANICDHVIPISQGGAVWDMRNFMALCHHHHNVKRGYERHGLNLDTAKGDEGLIPADRQQAINLLLKKPVTD